MKNLTGIIVIVSIIVCLGLSGCTSPISEIIGEWSLLSYGRIDNLTPALADVDTSIQFNKDRSFSGNVGCNNFGGNYKVINDKEIVFSNIVSTEMYCEETWDQETVVLGLFSKNAQLQIIWEDSDTMIITNDTSAVKLARFTSSEPQYRILFDSLRAAPFGNPDFEDLTKFEKMAFSQLFSMNPDGSDLRQITDDTYYYAQPDVSFDGKKIACSVKFEILGSNETDPEWEIVIMDIDGGNPVRLTDNNYLDFQSHFNHDGSRIVFISDSAKVTREDQRICEECLEEMSWEDCIKEGICSILTPNIYTMDLDGANVTQLTFGETGDVYGDPSFSYTKPSRIAYIHSTGFSDRFDLYIMDEDGSNKTLVYATDTQLIGINDPMFSRDGNHIIFGGKIDLDGNKGIPTYNIYRVNIDGTGLIQLTNSIDSDVLPSYSPDGNYFVFLSWTWINDGWERHIKVARSDGTNVYQPSPFPFDGSPIWYELH